MTTEITIDKAGRIVIPKPLREELHIAPGDALQIESEGEPTNASIIDLIDREREKRLRELS